jgi:hypothetical protein
VIVNSRRGSFAASEFDVEIAYLDSGTVPAVAFPVLVLGSVESSARRLG